MTCGTGDVEEVKEIPTPQVPVKNCVRCTKTKPIIRVREADVYCSECFLVHFDNKARMAFGHRRGTGKRRWKFDPRKGNEKIMLAVSGGSGSVAMAAQIAKQVRFTNAPIDLHVAFVDCSDLFNGQVNEAQQLSYAERCQRSRTCVEDVCRIVDLPLSIIPIQRRVQIGSDNDSGSQCRADLSELIRSPSAKLTMSQKEELLDNAVRQSLVDYAKAQNMRTVVLGTTATRATVRLLIAMSQGRGAKAPLEAAFAVQALDDSDVIVSQPLQSLLAKETAVYCRIKGLPTCPHPSLTSFKDPKLASIAKLSETFVMELQSVNASSVNTVIRAGLKMMPLLQFEPAVRPEDSANAEAEYIMQCTHCRTRLERREIRSLAARLLTDRQSSMEAHFHSAMGHRSAEGAATMLQEPLCQACAELMLDINAPANSGLDHSALEHAEESGSGTESDVLRTKHWTADEMKDYVKDFLL
eukprot:Clim_evm32s224 gene=Clim_evmTU32s224